MSKEALASAVFLFLNPVWLMLVSPGSTAAIESSEPISFEVGTESTCDDLQIYSDTKGHYDDWSDTSDFNCHAYLEEEWCDAGAADGYGRGWKVSYGTFEDWARLEGDPRCTSTVNYASPADYCCGCGGGCTTSLFCDPQVHIEADISIRIGNNDESLIWSLSEWNASSETYVPLVEGGNYTVKANEMEAHETVSMCLVKRAVFGLQISGSISATSHVSVWHNETCAIVFEATTNDTFIVFSPEANNTCVKYSVPAIMSDLNESSCKTTIVAENNYYAGQQLRSLMHNESVDTICLNTSALVSQSLPVLKRSLFLEGHCGGEGFEQYMDQVKESLDAQIDLCYIDAAGHSQLFKLEGQAELWNLTIRSLILKNAYDFVVSVAVDRLYMDSVVMSNVYTNTFESIGPISLTKGAKADIRRVVFQRNYIRGSTSGGITAYESELNMSDSVFLANSGRLLIGGTGSTLKMGNCAFVDNHREDNAPLIQSGVDINIISCLFLNNSHGSGGPIIRSTQSYPSLDIILSHSVFKDTIAEMGAIVNLEDASEGTRVLFEHCHVSSISASVHGGVLYSPKSNSTVEIRDSVLRANSAGTGNAGCLFIEGGILLVSNSTFSHNSASVDGGVLYMGSIGQVELSDSQFDANRATGGTGGLMSSSGMIQLTLQHSVVRGHSADDGGAFYAYTIGSHDQALVSRYIFIDSIFEKNQAYGNGGMMAGKAVAVQVFNCYLVANKCKQGGALYISVSGSLEMIDSQLHNNSAINGGAVASDWADIGVSNVTATLNRASRAGGTFYIGSHSSIRLADTVVANSYAVNGGVFSMVDSNASVTHSFLYDNEASDAAGVLYADKSTVLVSNCTFQNSHAMHYSGGLLNALESQVEFQHVALVHSGSALFGGHIHLQKSELSVHDIQMEDGLAMYEGGCISAVEGSSVHLHNAYLWNCSTTNGRGGGLYLLVSMLQRAIQSCAALIVGQPWPYLAPD
ncbi:hypothetical protein CYMTET_36712 [Cymbomonas tetramitiformis]|uniref:Right handed beta helix domain-containing protein n=1 Tax=Cymbomonas tetramitiformis TaxID=36881 RepID=A0AAE0F7S5_9CHLO|nr:hypothetical protein CYMTET_36712 [Cymbomonas tetramitiformis]